MCTLVFCVLCFFLFDRTYQFPCHDLVHSAILSSGCDVGSACTMCTPILDQICYVVITIAMSECFVVASIVRLPEIFYDGWSHSPGLLYAYVLYHIWVWTALPVCAFI